MIVDQFSRWMNVNVRTCDWLNYIKTYVDKWNKITQKPFDWRKHVFFFGKFLEIYWNKITKRFCLILFSIIYCMCFIFLVLWFFSHSHCGWFDKKKLKFSYFFYLMIWCSELNHIFNCNKWYILFYWIFVCSFFLP